MTHGVFSTRNARSVTPRSDGRPHSSKKERHHHHCRGREQETRAGCEDAPPGRTALTHLVLDPWHETPLWAVRGTLGIHETVAFSGGTLRTTVYAPARRKRRVAPMLNYLFRGLPPHWWHKTGAGGASGRARLQDHEPVVRLPSRKRRKRRVSQKCHETPQNRPPGRPHL